MYFPIDQMPDNSRIWIYQANRKLTSREVQQIASTLQVFCGQWAAHQVDLQTSFSIDHGRFVVLAVNENVSSPSGCSIDSSVHVLKSLEQSIGIDFFGRSEIAFKEGNEAVTYPLQELKKLFGDGRLNENSLTFNTLAQNLGDWKNRGTVTAGNTWLKRYIPRIPVS